MVVMLRYGKHCRTGHDGHNSHNGHDDRDSHKITTMDAIFIVVLLLIMLFLHVRLADSTPPCLGVCTTLLQEQRKGNKEILEFAHAVKIVLRELLYKPTTDQCLRNRAALSFVAGLFNIPDSDPALNVERRAPAWINDPARSSVNGVRCLCFFFRTAAGCFSATATTASRCRWRCCISAGYAFAGR